MKFGNYIKEIRIRLFNTINYLFQSHKRLLYVSSWVNLQNGSLHKRNFGDELNLYLLNEISNYNIRFYNRFFHLPHKNYLVIGSLIENFSNKKSIVWGSGALNGISGSLKEPPASIKAVRGKLTRDFLTKEGVECPEIYGDPALLLPYIYKPQVEKKWSVGIIPHIYDYKCSIIEELTNNDKYHLIHFDKYSDWRDVIDEIASCVFILSSSLHGLILSDAYKIPNLWIVFSGNSNKQGSFKYHDYYSSVNKYCDKAFEIGDFQSVENAVERIRTTYTEISYDPTPLINACPFEINKSLFDK